ncbi:MAG TPA: LTA synthase family protein [Rhodanobacteraceae bacterium]|nr:LTA synthase family protein [Rhodanobacteraceae bacterium]
MLSLAPVLFIGLSVMRAWRNTAGAGNYTGCHDCFWLPTFGHDAWLFAILLGSIAIASFVRWRWLGIVLRLLAALILVIYAADVALDSLLSARLHFGDVLRFGRHIDADFSVVRAAVGSMQGLVRAGFLVLVLIVAIGVVASTRRRPRLGKAFAIAAIASLAFSAYELSRPMRYVNEIFTWNVVETNLPQGRLRTFSPAFLAKQKQRADALHKSCSRETPFDGSVVIVLVESLSAWHSKLLGSSRDWTPELDAIARENHYFTHFYANGFTTSTAEVSILAARPPLAPAGKLLFDYNDYADPHDTLPDIAHRGGREAAFFTSGDTSFLDLGEWLKKLGYDVIGNNGDAFYNGMRRWQFGAAEDKALYDRFLDWMDKRDPSRPFVSTLLTVSTHPPYVDPRTAKIDPENAFKYVDAEIARFYRELKQRGFLDHGVLIVLGDHRTMTPLHEEEYRNHGERAFARIPFVVAGAVDMPNVIDTAFQQTDIAPSLASLFGLDACTSPFTGHFLRADPKAPDYVLHVRGDDRDRLDVYWDYDKVSGFRYDGDDSRWMNDAPPRADDVAAWIDVHRAPD